MNAIPPPPPIYNPALALLGPVALNLTFDPALPLKLTCFKRFCFCTEVK